MRFGPSARHSSGSSARIPASSGPTHRSIRPAVCWRSQLVLAPCPASKRLSAASTARPPVRAGQSTPAPGRSTSGPRSDTHRRVDVPAVLAELCPERAGVGSATTARPNVRWLASYQHLRYLDPALAAAAEKIIPHWRQAVAAYLGGERLGVVVMAAPTGGGVGATKARPRRAASARPSAMPKVETPHAGPITGR